MPFLKDIPMWLKLNQPRSYLRSIFESSVMNTLAIANLDYYSAEFFTENTPETKMK